MHCRQQRRLILHLPELTAYLEKPSPVFNFQLIGRFAVGGEPTHTTFTSAFCQAPAAALSHVDMQAEQVAIPQQAHPP